jgi:predicted nucleotide-binding protein
MPSSSKLSPAQAVPLLRKVFDTGTKELDVPERNTVALVTWLRHVSLLLSEIEGVSETSLNAMDRALHYWGFGTGTNGKALSPDDAFLIGMGLLRTQIIVLNAKAAISDTSADSKSVGRKVFIGHGRNPAWMALDKFLDKDLHLEIVEFNSEPTAGGTIIDRLKAMLGSVGFAFLIMTAEDHVGKRKDGIRARQNVIHEIGLFQGRLGFDKAIILLEEGCERFSNIDGLIYIPFPPGNIKAAFHDIRKTLEAAGLIKPSAP